jgi:hypothetical protein
VRPDSSEFASYIRERPAPDCPHRSPTDSEVWSPELGQRRLDAVWISSGDQDAHAEAGERHGDVEADFRGASGDERGLAAARGGGYRARTVATRPTTSSATMAA